MAPVHRKRPRDPNQLVADVGQACSDYPDKAFRNLTCQRLQVDQLRTFTHCKQSNRPAATKAPEFAGDTWTWIVTDADTKLVTTWYVGNRDGEAAYNLLHDLRGRVLPIAFS
jgi:hypothetical protein